MPLMCSIEDFKQAQETQLPLVIFEKAWGTHKNHRRRVVFAKNRFIVEQAEKFNATGDPTWEPAEPQIYELVINDMLIEAASLIRK